MSMDLHLLISCGYNSHNLYSIDIGLHMNTNAGAPGVAISLAERVREGDPAAENELVARFYRRAYFDGRFSENPPPKRWPEIWRRM